MLLPNTVFILGAGVSKEFKMPLGGVLKGLIRAELKDNVRKSDELHSAIYGAGFPSEHLSNAIKHIAEAMLITESIDNLVEHVKKDAAAVRIAKFAITACILEQEGGSDLFVPDRKFGLAGKAYDGTLGAIFRLIIGNVPVDDLAAAFARVKFITFNYDRTLEWFLLNALISHSGLTHAEAIKIVQGITIIHAYGSVGDLSWLTTGGGGIDYGCKPSQGNITSGGDRIKTFSEEMASGEREVIDAVMREADRVIILGCHPHPQNFMLLRPGLFKAEDVYMTVYMPPPEDPDHQSAPGMAGYAAPTITRVKHEFINDWPRINPHRSLQMERCFVEPLTSLQMVGKYGRTWTTRIVAGVGVA